MRAWAAAGLAAQLHTLVLAQYDHLIGRNLRQVCVDGCIIKAPGGGEHAGRSPVDRGKQGRKRSLLTDAAGRPCTWWRPAASVSSEPVSYTHLTLPTITPVESSGGARCFKTQQRHTT